MPNYTFKCDSCNTIEERIISVKRRNSRLKCESCGKILKRLVDCSPFHLKGDCWAKDGYSK